MRGGNDKKIMIATVFIHDLRIPFHIGETEHERKGEQTLIINIDCDTDIAQSVTSDDLAHTVDYRDFHSATLELSHTTNFNLIETLAAAIIDHCFANEKIIRAAVTIEKPNKLSSSKSVGIAVTKTR